MMLDPEMMSYSGGSTVEIYLDVGFDVRSFPCESVCCHGYIAGYFMENPAVNDCKL